MADRTVLDLYRHEVDAPRAEHYAHWTPAGRRVLSTEDFFARTSALADALADLGVTKGDRVLLLSDNRPEWHMVDLAVLDLGAADVPVYQTLTIAQLAYQLNDSGAAVAVAEDPVQMAKLIEIRSECSSLRHLIQIEGDRVDGVLDFETLSGGEDGGAEKRFWDRAVAVDEQALAIVGWSGTPPILPSSFCRCATQQSGWPVTAICSNPCRKRIALWSRSEVSSPRFPRPSSLLRHESTKRSIRRSSNGSRLPRRSSGVCFIGRSGSAAKRTTVASLVRRPVSV